MIMLRAVPVLALILLLGTPLGVQAEPVGRVIMTVGPVSAVDPDDRQRAISRHDAIYEGETVLTRAPRGRAQIRFRDDGLVRLQPGTEFHIEEYREPDADGEGEGGSAVMNLVTGALRKISGGIGQRDADRYEMQTPTATVGIRGTDYSLQYCDADCAGDGRRLGVYGRVDAGRVTVENEFGMQEFGNGDYFFVPDDGPPSRVLMPPTGVFDDSEDGDGESGDEGEDDGEADSGETASEDSDDEGGDGDAALTADEDGVFDSDDEVVFESGDSVTDALQNPLDSAVAFARISSDGASLVDGGLSRSAGLALQRDAGLVVAVDSDGRMIDVAAASPSALGGSGETLGVEWGYWEVTAGEQFVIDGDVFTNGLVMFATADGNLTTPGQLADAAGTLQFGLALDGPQIAFGDSASYDIIQFDVSLDVAAMSGTLDQFRLESFTNGVTFSNEPLTLDADGQFRGVDMEGAVASLMGGPPAPVSGDLEGVLLGQGADGGLIAFEVDFDDIRGIVIVDDESFGNMGGM